MAVTSVTLGTFYTNSDGKTVLGGAGGSGLDTQSLIKNLVTAKSVGITADQDKIKINDSKSTALSSFNTLLGAFQVASDALRTPPGVNNAASDAFQYTKGTVGNGGSAYVSVTSQAGAALQSYNISAISSIATSASQSSGTFNVNSADDDATVNTGASYFGAGTISFKGASIQISAGDSLNTIAATFNAVKSTTGVTASVISVDSTHYQLSFVATETGTTHNFNLSTATGSAAVLLHAGISAATSATNAVFKLNNISITRQSNNVSDVVSGVTFNILQTTPDIVTNYPVTIAADTSIAQNSIVNFVKAYNDIKTFAAQQTQLNADGTYASTAVLANDPTFRQAVDTVNSQVISPVSGLSGSITSLADIGITFTDQAATDTTPAVSNILTVDDGQLAASLTNEFQGVRNLFGFNFTADNPNLAIFSHTNSLSVSAFTLTADVHPNSIPDVSTFTATFAPSSGLSPITFTATPIVGSSGYSLTGPAGSVLDGLKLIYASTSSATIHVTATQGVADQLYNTTFAATKSGTGTLALALSNLKTNDTTLNDDITRQNTLVSQYQDQITKQFAALEQAISRTNTLLQSLNADQNARLTSSGN